MFLFNSLTKDADLSKDYTRNMGISLYFSFWKEYKHMVWAALELELVYLFKEWIRPIPKL